MADGLDSAGYVDIDFDTISQALSISTFRGKPLDEIGWTERFNNSGGAIKIEIGVLASEKPTEPEELSLGGFLTIVGEDDKPSRWIGQALTAISNLCKSKIRPYSHFQLGTTRFPRPHSHSMRPVLFPLQVFIRFFA